MSATRVTNYDGRYLRQGITTLHTLGVPFHTLSVTHNPETHIGTHSVRIGVQGEAALQRLHNYRWPSADRGEEAAVYHDGKKLHYLPPPSETLQSLIAGHHETHAWMPLLNKLAEEYPEHFEGPVAEHARARAGA